MFLNFADIISLENGKVRILEINGVFKLHEERRVLKLHERGMFLKLHEGVLKSIRELGS